MKLMTPYQLPELQLLLGIIYSTISSVRFNLNYGYKFIILQLQGHDVICLWRLFEANEEARRLGIS